MLRAFRLNNCVVEVRQAGHQKDPKMSGQPIERQSPRAARFPISMPLRYREPGETDWQNGKVENISRTGVLFTVRDLLRVSTRLEMVFDLPVLLEGAAPGQVYCQGEVVRTVMPAATDQPLSAAAHIEHYKFLPASEQEGSHLLDE
jgi:PilZ domain